MKIAHISDLHLCPPISKLSLSLSDWFSKRWTGYLNLRSTRGENVHSSSVLGPLLRDMAEHTNVDHLCLTGDITNISLREEFVHARNLLDPLIQFRPQFVSVTPGNHDAYVGSGSDSLSDFWTSFHDVFDGMVRVQRRSGSTELKTVTSENEPGPHFPYLRKVECGENRLGVLVLNSAVPRTWFVSRGSVSARQFDDARTLVSSARSNGILKSDTPIILVMHHPPLMRESSSLANWKSGLDDDNFGKLNALCDDLSIDLVIHGHTHQPFIGKLNNSRQTAVVEAGSTTYLHEKLGYPKARYNVYEFVDGKLARIEIRRFNVDTKEFESESVVPVG